MGEGSFWDDPVRAQKVIGELKVLRAWTVPAAQLAERFVGVEALMPDADSDFLKELVNELAQVEKGLEELEIRRMFSGELDSNNCYLSINSGAGGTEACDWAQMLARMYQRWAVDHGWEVQLLDSVEGEVAGFKSMTFKLTGDYAYGYARAEQGVHRLVRISPFDSGGRRHTSFASVDAVPEIADDVEVEIRPDDLRIDTFRASGAGGQHVNRTDSAVRITHLPTGIVVGCQQERSQLQNKESCMKMLRSRLYEKQLEERKKALQELGGEKKEIAWGSQIRSYVFQPYTLVKDNRTDYEVGDVQGMMDGRYLDQFIVAYLKQYGK